MSSERRPITIDDLHLIEQAEDPRISPDGRWVAYVRVTVDRQGNGYKRNIWLEATDGSRQVQLTRSGKDSSPRWSPDGKTLAFVSARDKKPQIYLLPLIAPGGEARALTSAPNGATTPVWSPDGTQMAYLSPMNADERGREDRGEKEAPPRDELDAKHRAERKEQDEKERFDPREMWRIPYRQGTSFVDERYMQLYLLPVAEGLDAESARPRRLTHTDAAHDLPVWSPDGAYLYVARASDPFADTPWRWQQIFRVRAADGEIEQVTGGDFMATAPLVSPDGRWLAYERVPHERLTERLSRLTVLPVDGSAQPLDLNLNLDRNPGVVRWSADSAALWFTAEDYGRSAIYRVLASGGAAEQMVGDATTYIADFDLAPDGNVAYVASTPLCPPELFYRPAEASAALALTDNNAGWLSGVFVQEAHELRWQSPAGVELQGWYLLPVGYEAGKKYPLALNIHGGPHVMWGPGLANMWHEWQCHAAQGYVVLFCNPRGSGGYGEAFQEALHAAWGPVVYEDVLSGVDTLLAQGFVDESRMAITGGSYGGYATAWIISHTQRFACAVSQRGVYSLLSFYGTSDVPLLITNEFDADPWEDPQRLWEHSPLAHAHQIKTPLLLIHSENDYRVPIADAEQLFAYVRRSGSTPIKMVRFPREGHELSRSGEPAHRIKRLEYMVEWFDKYCQPPRVAQAE